MRAAAPAASRCTLRHQVCNDDNRSWPAQPTYCLVFMRSPNFVSAPWCKVARALNYYVSLTPWRKDCLHYLTSITSPLCLELSKRQEHSTLPQSWLFDSSCLVSSICCNLSHNRWTALNEKPWNRAVPFNLMVLPAKLNNVTALHKMSFWIDYTLENRIFYDNPPNSTTVLTTCPVLTTCQRWKCFKILLEKTVLTDY